MPRKKAVPKPVGSTDPQKPQPPAVPDGGLVRLAGSIPAELLQQMDTAVRSEHWLFAVWRIDEGRIHLERTAVNFPTADLDKAVQLLAENLKQSAVSDQHSA